ncbi:YcbK family protein [Microvirga rosea]|uniref:YcbK family protein n=1 Tax=Microvirga rosea TaxID=2715425 RepID=UPI001D0B56FA|nr:D-Ala-D-Ala carboxypeptidase family metallohydrolase [Microvirga rosea]MCB8823013.1 D-Ala-D-Ala carboxypeptidase family metallohydrolase [Microvirga rosea]
MSTSRQGALSFQGLFRAGCLVGTLLVGGGVSAARAESEGTTFPDPQYASLPPPERMKDPAATGSLPNGGTKLETISPFSRSVNIGDIVLRKGAPTGCLPSTLRNVVADLSARFGEISVESTHRSSGRNRRAGGAQHSLHLACRAVDFRVHGRSRGVMAYLRSRPDVGGLKIYRNGIIHIDNGTRRSW